MRICTFDGCERKHEAHGLCRGHYRQTLKGVSLKPLRQRGAVCDFPGCEKPHEAKGLCRGHYSQVWVGTPLRPLRQPATGCDFPGCENPHRQDGLCNGHSQQVRAGSPLTPLRLKYPPFCTFPDCDRKHQSHGLCSTHYAQLLRGIPLRPIYSIRRKPGTGEDLGRKKLTRRNGHRRRKERKANAVGFCSKEQLEARIAYYGYRCAYCRGPYEHVDHVIPLSRGGAGWPSNLVPSCASCNCSKGNKNVWEWLKEFQVR